MKKIILHTLLLILLSGVCSCLDDKNDFNYKEINELTSPISNMDEIYSISVDEDLLLEPVFKFTIDSVHPDVSYEWYLDGKLLDVTTPTYTFNVAKSGSYEVTFSVTDNTTGIKFSYSSIVRVRSAYARGWVILSDQGGQSQLSFIKLQNDRYKIIYNGKEQNRDSVIYRGVKRNIAPDLGTGPIGIIEHLGYRSWDNDEDETYDGIIVMQDRWRELNGATFDHELYTDQAFGDDLPANFKPVEGAFSFTSKLLRDSENYIYLQRKPVANDFYTGFYTSVPLNNGMKFTGLYPTQRVSTSEGYRVIPACTEENTLVVIWDDGAPFPGTTIRENASKYNGEVVNIIDPEQHFVKMKEKIVKMVPGLCAADVDYNYEYNVNQKWVALMKNPENNLYSLRFFGFRSSDRPSLTATLLDDYYEKDLRTFSNYKDMCVSQHRRFAVVADGSTLWYAQYGDRTNESPVIPITGTPDKEIVSIFCHDMAVWPYPKQPLYDSHLGVAYADGTFCIYEVKEERDAETDIASSVSLKQVYPNEVETDNHFGAIKDVIYKYGTPAESVLFEF